MKLILDIPIKKAKSFKDVFFHHMKNEIAKFFRFRSMKNVSYLKYSLEVIFL